LSDRHIVGAGHAGEAPAAGISRRDFLKAAGAVGAMAVAGVPALGARNYALQTIDHVISAVGWKAEDPGAFYFAHVTDIHANDRGPLKMENKYSPPNFVTDINSLTPRPAFMSLTGDIISDAFRSPSSWPRSKAGFQYARKVLDGLNKSIELKLILGNNDCAWEMFKEVWPGRPLYWSFDMGGIHFVGLMGYSLWKPQHGNHAGIALDGPQLAWLKKDLAGREKQTLVLFTHEPWVDLSAHIFHSQVEPLLAGWTAPVWNVAGHIHRNKCHLRPLPRTTMRVVETMTPIGSWRPSVGAYRLLFASRGNITALPLRWLTCNGNPLGYELEKPESAWTRYVPPLEAAKDKLLWSVMIGAGDGELRGEFVKVQDRISNLRIRKDGYATFRVPLRTAGARPRALALVGPSKAAVRVCVDGAAWREATGAEMSAEPMGPSPALALKLGPEWAGAGEINVRLSVSAQEAAAGRNQVYLYGLALLR